jgi:hypothetical protein
MHVRREGELLSRSRSLRPGCAWALLALLTLAPAPAPAAAYESPPVLEAKKILPAKLQRGKGFHVAERVPTDGLTTEFVIQSEVGDFPARGRRILELREQEIVAIQKLRAMDDTKVFTDALKGTAERPIKAVVHMAKNPTETLKGLPDGVGRFFDRVSTGAERAYDAVASAHSAGDGAGLAATKGLEATRDVLGFEQEKRDLSKRLSVDPYTSNQELAEALDHVAYVAFSGRVGLNTLISVAVPGSLIITGTTATNNLVYDTPRGDLIVKVEERMRGVGASDEQLRAFQRNPNLTLSIQTGIAEALTRLDGVVGRLAVVDLAAGVRSEDQARFVLEGLLLLAKHHGKEKRIAELLVKGPLVARETDGSIVVPAPIDYVSWTERVAAFADRPDLAAPRRTILLTGQTTPRAMLELKGRGWILQEKVPL